MGPKWRRPDYGAPTKKLVPGCPSFTDKFRSSGLKLQCVCYMQARLGQDRAFVGARQLPSNILWHFAELLTCTSLGDEVNLFGQCYLEGTFWLFSNFMFTLKLICKYLSASSCRSVSIATHVFHFMGLSVAWITVDYWLNWEKRNFLIFGPCPSVWDVPGWDLSTLSFQTMHHSVPWSLLHRLVVILLTLGETFYP